MTSTTSKEAQAIKTQGNECINEGKFEEAILHYTRAIKLEPTNYTLYSNRSLAFLRLDQHYLALQDANETIRLEPKWAKGYFRRAEVEAASGLFDEAIISYRNALQLQPLDTTIIDCIRKITEAQKIEQSRIENTIWISSCIGLIFGIAIVVMDYTLAEKPSLTHPIFMVLFAIAFSGVGWLVGKMITTMRQSNTGKSLIPPESLDKESEEDNVGQEKKPKFSKAQARNRYKHGKL